MLAFGLHGSDGQLAPPLDDTFIHLQYARQLAGGHPFQYNTGDPASSGDSSFLYPFLLAPAYLLGLTNLQPLLVADVLNVGAHLGAVLLLYSLAYQLFDRPVALLSAGLFTLDGRLNWTFLSSMETGIYVGTLIAFFYLWLRAARTRRVGMLVLVGILATLLRPEGHILISLVCLASAIYWRQLRVSARHYRWLFLPVVSGLLPYAVNWGLTGTWQFNTAVSKSPWYTLYWTLSDKLEWSIGLAQTALKDIYLGLDWGRSPFPPLAILIGLLGVYWSFRHARPRLFHCFLLVTLLVGVGLALPLPPTHFYRYYQPYDWILELYLTVGVVQGLRWAVKQMPVARVGPGMGSSNRTITPPIQSITLVATAIGLALILWPQFTAFLVLFEGSTHDIYHQQMAFSAWLKQNTAPDARIAVNDVGAQKYLSDRYILDLAGLTNNALRGVFMSGWGSVYDVLATAPAAQRPQYLLIHPNVLLNNTAESVAAHLLSPVYSINVQHPTITAGPTETLYKLNWEYTLLDPTQLHLLHVDRQPLDQLNIGDIADEQRHGYRLAGRAPNRTEPAAIVVTSAYRKKEVALTESGRVHTGWEEFTVRSRARQPLILVARANLRPNADQVLLIWVNGQPAGYWQVHNERGGDWQEYEYTVPAALITSDRTTIRLDATFDPYNPGFTSYRYWVYSP